MIHHLTNISYPARKPDFLLRNLRPYFWQLPLEGPDFLDNTRLTEEDCVRWIKVHPSYLSAYESINLGIKLFEIERTRDDLKFKLQYLQQAFEQGPPQLKSWAMQAIGIAYFEEALKGPIKEQKSLLRQALASFLSAQEHDLTHLNPRLYQVIVLVAQDKLPEALKKLYTAQKLTCSQDRPELTIPLYEVLAKIYASLGQERVSRFYLTKLRMKRLPIKALSTQEYAELSSCA